MQLMIEAHRVNSNIFQNRVSQTRVDIKGAGAEGSQGERLSWVSREYLLNCRKCGVLS